MVYPKRRTGDIRRVEDVLRLASTSEKSFDSLRVIPQLIRLAT
jgi:hypothetical protein